MSVLGITLRSGVRKSQGESKGGSKCGIRTQKTVASEDCPRIPGADPDLFLSGDFQLHRKCGRVDVRIVVFVDARFESTGVDGVLGAKAEAERYCLLCGERVEVENRLVGGKRELLEPATCLACCLFLEGLKVFAEQFESGRNAEVHHHHVRLEQRQV